MVGAMIHDGDIVIMRPVPDPENIKNGTIVAARVEGEGNTLKYFHRNKGDITLKAANPDYKDINRTADQVMVQGKLIGMWRDYNG